MKTIYKTIFIFILFAIAHTTFAARLYFDVANPVFGTDQDVTLPLMFDPEGVSVNAIEASISIPKLFTYKDVVTGSSIIPTWIEMPDTNKNTFTFSGIIPGGFDGVIDPFKGSMKFAGLVAYVTFHTGNQEGVASLFSTSTKAYTNDGEGTEVPLSVTSLSFTVKKGAIFNSSLPKDETSPAPFTIELSHDPALFNGKYFIAFESQDKESGISYYEVKEGSSDFIKATSPYELSRQELGAPIVVRAVDKAGNTRLSTLNPDAVSKPSITIPPIFYLAILLLVLFIIFRKKLIK